MGPTARRSVSSTSGGWSPSPVATTRGKQVVVRYRNVRDKPGFEIVTPLLLANGDAVLVDRGFLARQGGELAPGTIPSVPSGEVTVTGRLRHSERGGHDRGGDRWTAPPG